MMNADKPAYPELTHTINSHSERIYVTDGGLTKREAFAMAAMEGILSNANSEYRDAMLEDAAENAEGDITDTVAMQAVNYADALLEALS